MRARGIERGLLMGVSIGNGTGKTYPHATHQSRGIARGHLTLDLFANDLHPLGEIIELAADGLDVFEGDVDLSNPLCRAILEREWPVTFGTRVSPLSSCGS